MAETSLSTLCTICHAGVPKYTCPRCSARTCQLACVRLHKARALCSGVRDPGTYLKRSALATPSAFDKDFNFLSGLERGIERAERDVEARGINDGGERVARGRTVRDERLKRALEDARVTVLHAPRGMKRARENGTGFDKRRRLVRWTVEWRFCGRECKTTVPEHVPLVEAHDAAVLDAWQASSDEGRREQLGRYAREAGVTVPLAYPQRRKIAETLGIKAGTEGANVPGVGEVGGDENENEAGGKRKEGNERRRKFYLHLPDKSTAMQQVVAHVEGKTCLRDMLRGRTVREFPTVLVAMPGADELGDDYSVEHRTIKT